MRKAFTLIELILYVALIAIMLSALLPIILQIMSGAAKSGTGQEVNSGARYLSERLKYEIRNASDINIASSSFGVDFAVSSTAKFYLTKNATPGSGTIGATTTYVGTGAAPFRVAFDGVNMWTANSTSSSVTKISPTGATTTYAIGVAPYGIAFDGTNMWTANFGSSSVTKITPTGATTTYGIGAGTTPISIAFDGTNMWTANNGGASVTKISPTGATTTYSGTGAIPYDIAFDGVNMWTANSGANSVTKITPTGVTTTYPLAAGTTPSGIAFDGTNMWTANFGNTSVTKISPTGATTTYSGTGANPIGIAFDGTNMWTANSGANSVTKISPTGATTTYSGTGASPKGIAFDGSNYIKGPLAGVLGTNMWVANNGSSSVTKVTAISITATPTSTIAIDVASGSLRYTIGTTTPVLLNSIGTTVSSLIFSNYSTSTYRNIGFVLTMTAVGNALTTRSEFRATTTIDTSVELRSK